MLHIFYFNTLTRDISIRNIKSFHWNHSIFTVSLVAIDWHISDENQHQDIEEYAN